MVSPACSPDCSATEPSCGSTCSVFESVIAATSPTTNTPGYSGKLEIRADRDAVAPLELDPERLDEAVALEACAPDERVRGDHLPGCERDARRRDGLHPGAGHDLDRPLLERVLRVFAQVRLEHREDLVAGLDEDDARLLLRQVRVVLDEVVAVELGDRSRRLDAGRPASDDDDRQGAVVDERRVLVGGLPAPEDVVLEPDRVGQRVHRKRVLRGPARAEEVHLRPEREHEEVVGDGRETVEADLLRREVDPGDRSLVDRRVRPGS